MDLRFNTLLAKGYKSASQIARVLTEDWLARNMYCPVCGEVAIHRAKSNAPVQDYICEYLEISRARKLEIEDIHTFASYRKKVKDIALLDKGTSTYFAFEEECLGYDLPF